MVHFSSLLFVASATYVVATKLKSPIITDVQGTDSLTPLPIKFSSMEQYTAETGGSSENAKYFEISQCDDSAQSYQYAQLTLICPENYNLDPDNGGYVVLEVSKCKDNFNSSCTFITNYEWGTSPIMYTNISWKFETGNQVLYGRYLAYNRETPFSVMLTYSDYAREWGGSYDARAIGSPLANGANYDTLYQYILTTKTASVLTNHYVGYQLSFCKLEYPCNGNNGYKVNVQVVSDPNYPHSAFNVILCGVADVGTVDQCRQTNSPYAVSIQTATPLTVASIESNQHNLSKGLFVVIQGEGAEASQINSFLLSATATAN